MSIDYGELLISFVSESNDMLDQAESSILALESGFDEELVNSVFRFFHTIKGDSGIFGFQRITDLAHALENVLSMMRAKTLDITMQRVDLLLTGVDRLRQMINNSDHLDAIDETDVMTALKAQLGEKNEVKESDAKVAQETPAVKSASAKGGRLQIIIPAQVKKDAIEANLFLSLVYVDLYKQNFGSLLEIRQLLEQLEDSGALVMQGVLMNLLPGISDKKEAILPYYLLLQTNVEVVQFLRQYLISGRVLKVLCEPGLDPQSAVSPLPVEMEEENLSPAVEKGAVDENATMSVLQASESLPSSSEDSSDESSNPSPVQKKESILSETSEEGMAPQTAKVQKKLKESVADTHLKVHVELLDELITLAGETIIARNDLVQKMENIKEPGLVVATKKVSYLITKLQESIMRTRLQEIETVFQRLPRIVRDVSNVTGKKVDLQTEGGEVELDKTLIDAIVDPVMHMVRNSIDHGIELPDERAACGKKEKGVLRLNASLRGGNVILKIIDDGKGIDVSKIREKAIQKGFLSEREASEKEDQELFELLFEAGFSTAASVTQVSGRGVGMDVVRSNFKRIGGSIDISSEMGKGTVFTAVLPQTLSIITSLLIMVGDKLYALPQQNIEELVLVDPDKIAKVEDHLMYKLHGHLMPLVETERLLYPDKDSYSESPYIAVVRSDRHRFGMMIEQIINPAEIVVKPLGEHFSDLFIFSGAAIMGDGEAVLIIDVPGFARFSNMQPNARDEDFKEEEFSDSVGDSGGQLLFSVADAYFSVPVDLTPRVEKIAVSQIDHFMGVETIVFNEDIVPLVRLENLFRLEALVNNEKLYVLIFEMDGMRIGIVAQEIYRVVEELGVLDRSGYLGNFVIGQTILSGEKVIVLNIAGLFSELRETQFKALHTYLVEDSGHSSVIGEDVVAVKSVQEVGE